MAGRGDHVVQLQISLSGLDHTDIVSTAKRALRTLNLAYSVDQSFFMELRPGGILALVNT